MSLTVLMTESVTYLAVMCLLNLYQLTSLGGSMIFETSENTMDWTTIELHPADL
jgi:hypothetical protein